MRAPTGPADPAWGDDGTGPDGFRVPWSIVHGYALVLVAAVAPVIVVAGVAALGVDLDAPLTATAVTGQALLITLAGIVAWLTRTRRLSWRLLGPERPRPLRHIGRGVAAGVVITALAVPVGWAVRVMQGSQGPLPPLRAAATTAPAVTAAAVVAVVIAPVLVTLVHHGVLYQALRRRLPAATAVSVSAAVFAVGAPGAITLPGVARGLVAGALLAALFEHDRTTVVVLTATATVGMLSLVVRVAGS